MSFKRFLLIDPEYLENPEQRERFKTKESFIDKLKSIVNNNNLSSLEMTKLLNLQIKNFFTTNNNEQSEKIEFKKKRKRLEQEEEEEENVIDVVEQEEEEEDGEQQQQQQDIMSMESKQPEQLQQQEEKEEENNIFPTLESLENNFNNQDDTVGNSPIVTKFIDNLDVDDDQFNIDQIKSSQIYKILLKKSNIKWDEKTGKNVEFMKKTYPNISIYKLINDTVTSTKNVDPYKELRAFYSFLSKNHLKSFVKNKNLFPTQLIKNKIKWQKFPRQGF